MAPGDHPGGFAGACWAFTNADSLRFYRDNDFVAEFAPDRRGRFAALPHPPIEIHDFVGLLLEKYEGLDRAAAPQVAAILNEMRRDAMELSPLSRARMYSLRLSWNELLQLYYKYIGVLGSPSAVYRFEAVAWPGRPHRREGAGAERPAGMHRPQPHPHRRSHLGLRRRQPPGHRPERQPPALLRRGRPVERGGAAAHPRPQRRPLRGGMAGTYLATTGEAGPARLRCRMEGALDTEASLTIRRREEERG